MANFLSKTVKSLFGGNKSEKDVKALQPLVDQINEEYEKLHQISDDELRNKTAEFKARIAEHTAPVSKEIERLRNEAASAAVSVYEKDQLYNEIDKLTEKKDDLLEEALNLILPEAFAVVRETARRFKDRDEIKAKATELDRKLAAHKDYIRIDGDTAGYSTSWIVAGNRVKWDMVHYDVQLIGGIVLHQGKIAEMATGEGKTLVATLPAYLNGLAGEGVHIITVNDYLARRDSEWMAPIFEFLGLTVDCIDKYEPHSPQRRAAYNSDVTYGTNNEFGFDYLRDNMVQFKEDMVQRKLHYAMVDEVDSVLIDDARTPLIISGPVPKSNDEEEFFKLKPRIERLVEAQRKLVHKLFLEAKRQIAEGKDGVKEGGLALLRAHRGLPKYKQLIKYLSEEGIKQILLRTESYYMRDQSKDMPLVDEELFFVIDEKNNNVELTEKGIELITTAGEEKDFFVLPDVGAQIAEIENSELSESEKNKKKDALLQDFAIKSQRLHTIQQLLKAYTLFERDVEYVLMDGKVKIVDEQTGRVMEGRRYSDGLHQAIEAKENVKIESTTQTHATITLQNYFRMYHKLAGMTGTAVNEAGEFWEIYKLDVVIIPTNKPVIRDDRDDVVYKTKKEKYNAVIEEILENRKAGRPSLVGTTSVEVSELLSRMLKMKGIPHNVLNAKQHQREADIVAEAGKPGQVTIATNMAGRGTDIKITDEVRKAGGLAIIGTERHESRRIDRQLRGRAGRQGDPGASQFFVSLEDDLMRLFGSERIAKVMDKLGYKEGDMIQHSMISKSIERAQRKVEENNFGIRKRLLEYDDVMNSQRELIYKRRLHALSGERLSVDLENMVADVAEDLIERHRAEGNFEEFKMDLFRTLSIEVPFDEKEFQAGNPQMLADKLIAKAHEYYKRKSENIIQTAYPLIKQVYDQRRDTVDNIIIPFSEGRRVLNVKANLQKVIDSEGRDIISQFEKSVSLALVDEAWKEHLRQMDELKQAVQAASYEQKDPLLIYKFEAFELFKEMLINLNRDIISFLYHAYIPIDDSSQVKKAAERRRAPQKDIKATRMDKFVTQLDPRNLTANSKESKKRQPVVSERKVGRNDPCPCGSGKKYKKCCGATTKVEA